MKIKDHLKNNRRKYVFYGILAILFITVLSIYITAKVTDNSLIETAYNDRMKLNTEWFFDNLTMKVEAPAYATFDGLLSEYVDDFFIYTISAIVILWVVNVVLHAVRRRISPDIHNTLHVLIRALVLPIFLIAYVSKFEPFTGSIIGVAATLGAAIGIAAARSVSDLISGLYMVFSKHHNVGDYIIIPEINVEGVVQSISINYITVLQPDESTSVIPNSRLRELEIENIAVIELPEDQDEKDELKEIILYGRRVGVTEYSYPLKWATHSDASHAQCVDAIQMTERQFEKELEEPVTWTITDRDRLNRRYQIQLVVLDAEKLLDLPGNFLKALEANYENLRQ
ncbi:MAG: mechanosensitive ion channel [Candidatus Heimdallarchaeota archaeon]|nr:mechanosensitive ion channel [Candidatus Heimdallarchaeota archaeon]